MGTRNAVGGGGTGITSKSGTSSPKIERRSQTILKFLDPTDVGAVAAENDVQSEASDWSGERRWWSRDCFL